MRIYCIKKKKKNTEKYTLNESSGLARVSKIKRER